MVMLMRTGSVLEAGSVRYMRESSSVNWTDLRATCHVAKSAAPNSHLAEVQVNLPTRGKPAKAAW
jgi:hypothetical protein